MPTVRKASLSKRLIRYVRQLQLRQIVGLVLLLGILIGLPWLIINQQRATVSADNHLQVVATFYPLYNFAQQVGGELVEVVNLTPAGGEIHSFEPTPQDLSLALKADVFIYNDPAMEPWVAKFLTDYNQTAVEASAHIEGHDHHDEDSTQPHQSEEHEHNHGADPHSWTDPILAQSLVQAIADGFKKADPAQAAIYQTNADIYIAQLNRLDQDFASGLANCQHRTIITWHAAFSFLAERYNLTVLPIAGISPEQEPGAAQMAQLAKLVKQYDIDYIFFEAQTSQHLAQSLAQETGAQTAILNPLETLSPAALSQGQDYLSVQRTNLANLRQALSCS